VTIRRLGPGDEAVVAALATYRPLTEDEARVLVAHDDTILLVAFDETRPVGFVLAYVLRRRHGDARQLFVYEVDVTASHRRRGVATALLRELESLAVAAGISHGFVLTQRDNDPAMHLYRSLGGREESEDVVWEFEYRAH
jgi:ribosomal protein S18 acetylase RimI-like enzyme